MYDYDYAYHHRTTESGNCYVSCVAAASAADPCSIRIDYFDARDGRVADDSGSGRLARLRQWLGVCGVCNCVGDCRQAPARGCIGAHVALTFILASVVV